MNPLKVNVGDLLVGTYIEAHLRTPPPKIVTVKRVTPGGRILLTEYPGQQYESLTSGGRLRGNGAGPYRVRTLQGEETVEGIRAERQRWVAAEAARGARHDQVRLIRRKMEELENRLPSSWECRGTTPDYPYKQSDLDALTTLLDHFLSMTPKKVGR